MGVLRQLRRKNQSKSLERHLLELGKRRREISSENVTGEAGDKKGRPLEIQGRQGEVSGGRAYVRHYQCLRSSYNDVNGIGLQETKRGKTPQIVVFGYRVSGDCSGIKGRNVKHGIESEIKEIIEIAGKDGIATDCISTRLLKTRVLIKSSFFTFVVAYAPTEEAAERQRVEYMTALNRSTLSMPAWEYNFVLTNMNAKTRKRAGGDGEEVNSILGTYGQDVYTAGCCKRQQARSSQHCFFHPKKWRVLHLPKHQLQHKTNTSGLYPDKAGRPPIGPLR